MIALSVITAFLLDFILGDPVYPFHPVRLIGYSISYGEKIIRKITPDNKYFLFCSGCILTLFVVFLWTGLTFYALKLLLPYKMCFFIFHTLLSYTFISARDLERESMKVYYCLENKDIDGARKKLSYIVGRDTENLSEEKIVNATVETVAENTSDGVVAPLLYMMIFGVLGGVFYKCVNTLDSMIGYKNEKYLYFGKFSARFDDALNLIPARFSAVFMMIASFILRYNYKNAVHTYIVDRYKHKSPNSAHTEAVAAGALEIQLGGDSFYFGKLVKKPTIGFRTRKSISNDILRANRLMYVASLVALVVFAFLGDKI